MEPSQQPVAVTLTPEQQRFVQQQVESGRFSSVVEVLLEGLRGLQEQEAFIDANRDEIRRIIEEGAAEADRGEFVDGEAVMEAWRQRDAAARREQQQQQKRRA